MDKIDVNYWAKEIIDKIIKKKPDIKKVVSIDVLLSNLGEILHVIYTLTLIMILVILHFISKVKK